MRRRWALPLVLLLAAGAAAAAIVGSRAGTGGEAPIAIPARPAEGVDVITTVTPSEAFFGDLVLARLDLVVDDASVDADELDVRVQVEPFERRGEAISRRASGGGVTVVRYEYELECLVAACAPQGSAIRLSLPQVIVGYARTDGEAVIERRVDWPEITIGSRVAEADLIRPRARADASSPVAATSGIDPTALGWLAASLAGALALAAGGVLLVALRRGGREALVAAAGPPPDPLADARPAARRRWLRGRSARRARPARPGARGLAARGGRGASPGREAGPGAAEVEAIAQAVERSRPEAAA
ncbi:MAG: hypothetical protein R3C15_09695 [Thermoleophilia bacterium]